MGRRRRKGNPVHGWLILDKPLELTSTQALGRARYFLNAQKAGHAGTLDPLATGILPIAFGEATKTIPYVQDAEKIYEFTVSWGSATDTDDCEGDITNTSDVRPSEDKIKKIIPQFLGVIEQTPPRFSAIKINGERAYDLARDGEEFEIKSREVEVFELELISHESDQSTFRTTCGKGTYVRALARDMALALGTFGHIKALRRLAVGGFTEKNAILLDELEKMAQSAAPEQFLMPVETALDDIPALALTASEANRLTHGQSVSLLSRQDQERLLDAGLLCCPNTVETALAKTSDKPIALVEVLGAEIKPVRVLNL